MGDTDIDARSDVYALGIVLGNILDADAEPPPELTVLRERATAEKREARIQTARELGDEVQRFLDGDRDLAMRRKLALEHLELAQGAMVDNDGFEARRKAMMQAGRALALDPELAAAGQVITHLVVEPPKDVPPEANASIEADELEQARALYRGSTWGSLGYLVLVPPLLVTGSVLYAGFGLLAALGGTLVSLRGRQRPLTIWASVITNGIIVMILSRLYSPLFVAPGVAIALAAGSSGDPKIRGRLGSVQIWLALSAAVLLPMVGELLGWLSPTVTFNADGSVLVHGLAMTGVLPIAPLVPLYVLGVVGLATLVGHIERESAWTLRRAFHVQAWQVRQLMPDMRRR